MSKTRRVVRKVLPHGGGDIFDEQLWPTYAALVVLGGFSMGVSVAYLQTANTPWYANAILYLVLIPLLVAGLMVAFRYVDNRTWRRSMQFSVVMAAIVHLIFVVVLNETNLFTPLLEDQITSKELIERRPPKFAAEYRPQQLLPAEDRPREEFEKPVETTTPEPEPEEIVRRDDTTPEITRPQPQPAPVKENEPTPQPDVVAQRQPVNETAPKAADTPSKLSRQSTPSPARVSQVVDVPQNSNQKSQTAEVKPAEALVQRQQAASEMNRRGPQEEATTPSPTEAQKLARATTERSPIAETSAQPTLKRQMNQPQATPAAQVATAEAPAASKQTSPDAMVARNTQSQRQTTASPEAVKRSGEPTPDVSPNVTAAAQRQQQEAEPRPTLAQSATPTNSRQPRVTTRTEVAATAPAVAAATPAPVQTQASSAVSPQATAVARAAPAANAQAAPAEAPAAQPNAPDSPQPAAQMSRAVATNVAPAVTANPTAAPTLTRQANAPSLPQVAQASDTPQATTPASASAEIAAASTATRRQETASTQTAARTGNPTPAITATDATSPSPTPSAVRRTNATPGDAPAVATSNAAAPSTGRANDAATPNVVTSAASVAANAAPQTASGTQPGAAPSLVARQPTANSPGATRTQPAQEVATGSTTTQVVHGGTARAQQSSVPTIDPHSPASPSPARAIAQAASPASPVAIDSPAARLAAQGAGDPSAEPARLALNRGLVGTAGEGRSPNLDISTPNGASPAMVASSAARRVQSTQDGPRGDALSPSAPATLARSRAGAERATSSLRAEPIDYATAAGSQEVADITAGASAALKRADSNAPSGAVTGAKGNTEVDLGSTQIVADTGAGRAAGGGQPQTNFETMSPQLARSARPGGASEMAIAAAQAAPAPAAPAGTGGGQPPVNDPGPVSVATARSVAGGNAAASGGPSAATEQGLLAEQADIPLVADRAVSRADNSEGKAGSAAAGGVPALESEEEKARRLARRSGGGAPQVAIAGAVAAEAPASPMGAGGDGGGPKTPVDATAVATSASRANTPGGAPAGGSTSVAAAAIADAGQAGGGEVAASGAVARAEMSDGAAGMPAAGGGTSSPRRAAAGAPIAANVQAATVELAGGPQSAGKADGEPIEAQGLTAAKVGGGAPSRAAQGPLGAIAGDVAIAADSSGAPGSAAGRRTISAAAGDGPEVGDVANAGIAGKKSSTTLVAAGGASNIEIPQVGPTSAVAQAELDHMMGGTGAGTVTRQTGDAIAVSIDAPEAVGGLGTEFAPQAGVNLRAARSDASDIQLSASRFDKKKSGGLPSFNTTAVLPTDSFKGRASRTQRGPANMGGGAGSPPPQTEDAIEAGLVFLARNQQPDGRWKLQGLGSDAALQADSAATALALLAFQGAGYNHREHQYKDVVRGGLEFLVKNQKDNGDLFLPLDDNSNRSVWLYSHSLAALALCEAYGMTQDPNLKEPAQKAMDFIIAGQHKERGGWRYAPGIGTDTSVTGWMMMALKSGELSNLQVPPETYQRIQLWLNSAQASPTEPHLYRYNPLAPDTPEQRHGRKASKTMTAVGLLMRLYGGWKRDNVNMRAGADYLQQHLATIGTTRDPQRDTYYWYYATQVMFHMGGEHWQTWNNRLHPLLIQSQIKDGPYAGSWDPISPVPDRWAPHAGRLYVTTMNLLSLEVYYRHLPIYEDAAK